MHKILSFILFFISLDALADPIYKWTDNKGNIHYDHKAPASKEYELINYGTETKIKSKKTKTLKAEETTAFQKLVDSSQSKIISWNIKEESDDRLLIKINYFYDGIFNDVQLWISASSVEPGKFIRYSVRPTKISKGYNSALVSLGVSTDAERNFCTSKLEFSVYGSINGSRTKTFIKSLVDHKKCWKNKHFEPKTSTPIRVQ